MRTNGKGWLLGMLLTGVSGTAEAQVNSWTNSLNLTHKWEDSTKWSLGVPPAAGQSVFITNGVGVMPRSRFVMIDATTASSFSGTMSVSNVTVAVTSPSLGNNSLFLNNAGLATPLRILDGLTINSGGSVAITNSTLAIGGTGLLCNLSDNGNVFLNTGTFVATNFTTFFRVGDTGPGSFTVANGTCLLFDPIVGYHSTGTLTVAGGTSTFRSLILGFDANVTGTVWLTGGQITCNLVVPVGQGGIGKVTVSNGTFVAQEISLGANFGSVFSGAGTLTVAGGTVTTPNFQVGECGADFVGFAIVKGGDLFVTNAAHNAVLDVHNGLVLLTSGQLVVDKVVMTNDCALFIHTGGSLSVGSLLLDPNLDADADGLPNGWEQTHGLDPLGSVGVDGYDGDPDGDGYSNYEEYLGGSDPQNPLSTPLQPNPPPFQITSILRSGNNIVLMWTTPGGTTNQVQVTMGGSGGNYATNGFTNLGPQLFIGGSGSVTTNYTDTGGATNKPARFYRVRLVP